MKTVKIFKVLLTILSFAVFMAAIGVPDLFGAFGLTAAFPLLLANYETSTDAKQKRSEIWDKMEGLIATRKAESRAWNTEEQKKYDKLKTEFDALTAHISGLEENEKRRLIMAGKQAKEISESRGLGASSGWYDTNTGEPVTVLSQDQKLTETFGSENRGLSIGRVVQAYLTGNRRMAEKELRSGYVGLDTIAAGAAVPSFLWADILDKARALSVIGRAKGVQTAIMEGAEMKIARFNTDPTFEVKSENEKFNISGVDVDGVNLKGYTIGTVVPLSRELAADSPNFAQALEKALVLALAKKMDQLYLFGTGTTQPLGISVTPGVQEITSGNHLTYSDIIKAWEKIASHNVEPGNLFVNPRDLAALTEASKTDFGYIPKPELLKDVDFLHSSALPSNLGTLENESIGIMGDFASFMMAIRQTAQLEITTTGSESFLRHQLLVKLTFRGDCAVLRPEHFVKITELQPFVQPV